MEYEVKSGDCRLSKSEMNVLKEGLSRMERKVRITPANDQHLPFFTAYRDVLKKAIKVVRLAEYYGGIDHIVREASSVPDTGLFTNENAGD